MDLSPIRDALNASAGSPLVSDGAAAEAAGYSHAFALPEGPEPSGPYAVPRVGINHGNTLTHCRIKTSASYLPLRTGAAYQAARHVKRAVSHRLLPISSDQRGGRAREDPGRRRDGRARCRCSYTRA